MMKDGCVEVTEEQAKQIAEIQYVRIAELRYTAPYNVWVKNRSEELMKCGALPTEVEMLKRI
jgi:hypothetical protein